MLCGVFTTLLIPETKRQTLEELAERYHGDRESIDASPTEDNGHYEGEMRTA